MRWWRIFYRVMPLSTNCWKPKSTCSPWEAPLFCLELNTRVLCGTSEQKRREYHKHIAANNRYFYERTDAGIHDLYEWYTLQRHEPVWHRAAGIYIRILSEPQVFIEGNDRTGALVMSYILAKEGQPPFVLTAANAKAYFESSALIKKLPRNGLANLFRLPRLKARIADFLKDQAHSGSFALGGMHAAVD